MNLHEFASGCVIVARSVKNMTSEISERTKTPNETEFINKLSSNIILILAFRSLLPASVFCS